MALQGTVRWDTAVVKYNSISFGASAITLNSTNINLSATSAGYLTFLWYDNNLQGQATNDSTSLFSISFTKNGNGKGKGLVRFSNTPTQLEIDSLGAGGTPVNNTNAAFTDGYIITPFLQLHWHGRLDCCIQLEK